MRSIAVILASALLTACAAPMGGSKPVAPHDVAPQSNDDNPRVDAIAAGERAAGDQPAETEIGEGGRAIATMMRKAITGGSFLTRGTFGAQTIRASVHPTEIALDELPVATTPNALSLKTTAHPDVTGLVVSEDVEIQDLPDWMTMSHLPDTHKHVRVKNAIGHIEIGEPGHESRSGFHFANTFDTEHERGPQVACGTHVGMHRMRWQTLSRGSDGKLAYTITDGWFDMGECKAYEVRRTVIQPSELIPSFAYGYRQKTPTGEQLVVLTASDQIQTSTTGGESAVQQIGALSRVVVPLQRGNAVSIVGAVSRFTHREWRRSLPIPRVDRADAWMFGIDIIQLVGDEQPTAIGYASPQQSVPIGTMGFSAE